MSHGDLAMKLVKMELQRSITQITRHIRNLHPAKRKHGQLIIDELGDMIIGIDVSLKGKDVSDQPERI